jgi:hypothetical protein
MRIGVDRDRLLDVREAFGEFPVVDIERAEVGLRFVPATVGVSLDLVEHRLDRATVLSELVVRRGEVVVVRWRPPIDGRGKHLLQTPLVIGLRVAGKVSNDQFVDAGKTGPLHREGVTVPDTGRRRQSTKGPT